MLLLPRNGLLPSVDWLNKIIKNHRYRGLMLAESIGRIDNIHLRSYFTKSNSSTSTINQGPHCNNSPIKANFFSFSRSGKDSNLATIEKVAEEEPDNPRKQAAYYRILIESDELETVIRRFEDSKYAKDTECVIHYLCALYSTSQLERASKFILNQNNAKEGGASNTSSVNGINTQFLVMGTKDRPLHVVNDSSGGSGGNWSRRFSSLLNVSIIAAILYSLFAMNESKLGGMKTKVHKLFKKNQGNEGKGYTFDDVEGCDEAKEELQQVVEFLKNPSKFTKLGAKMPKGVLLVGPPGTGKTLLAKAVAGEADVPFIYASGSEFDEMFVGIGSVRIRQMFQNAKEQAPAIIFIDEIDAVGSKRNPRDPQHSRMSLNQLLIELDGFSENTGIVVIAATNFPETLDKALLRPGRFDKHVHVPLPDIRGRRKILDLFTRGTRLGRDVDLNLVSRATPGFSGADLNKLVNQAKIMASVENCPNLQMKHLEQSRDEMLMGSERKSSIISAEDRKLTAFHEGGHALVALYTPHATPLHKATIIPRGSALGLVSQVPDQDEHSVSRKALLARMDVAMGGRMSEELLFGQEMVTTGASSDFTQATRIARAMVLQFGMSEKIGPIVFTEEELESIGSDLRTEIDSEIKLLLEESKMRAKNILQEHRQELDRLAAALLEYETLTKDEIISVCRGEKIRTTINLEKKTTKSTDKEKEKEDRNTNTNTSVTTGTVKSRAFTIFF